MGNSNNKPANEKEKAVETAASATVYNNTVTNVDPHRIVTVRNGFYGKLVYESKKTGETFIWDEFGAEQDMEIGELRNARNSNRKYFENNWFMFDEAWIVDYLGVSRYYNFAISVDDFDSLFAKPVNELKDAISKLSEGQKQSVAFRARQMVANGEIDSNKTIAALEKSLGIELIDR